MAVSSLYQSAIFKPKLVTSAFKNQVLSPSAIKYRGKFRIFQFASAMLRQKNCQRLSRNICISRRKWLRHTSVFCQGLWFSLLTTDTTYSTYIILFTGTGLKREKQKTRFLPLIFISLCVLFITGEHIIKFYKNLVLKI